jgi:hypothetical protein
VGAGDQLLDAGIETRNVSATGQDADGGFRCRCHFLSPSFFGDECFNGFPNQTVIIPRVKENVQVAAENSRYVKISTKEAASPVPFPIVGVRITNRRKKHFPYFVAFASKP